MSVHINDMLDDKEDKTEEEVPLPTISSKYLRVIIEYCEHFSYNKNPFIPYPLPSNNLRDILDDPWELQFIQRYSLEEKLELLKAANYLNLAAIFELCCAAVGAEFKGKSFEQVKSEFGLGDVKYSPEVDEEL
jgi:hypothetical protein